MYVQIHQLLAKYGYKNILLNTSDIYFDLQQEKEEGYAVVTLDETRGNKLTAEQFRRVSEQIRVFLQQKGCYRCHFLYLLITEDDSSVQRLFQQYECFWRIVPSSRTVMVFETADEVFMELRRPLEELFQEEPPRRVKKKIPWCNLSLIVLNVLVFIYIEFFNVFSAGKLVDVGALGWHEVLEQGQWYRMFTSLFLHSGAEHLFNNMLLLAFIGFGVESELGSRKYGVLYLGSGILAGCTSMVYNMLQNDYIVSIGASGAIFGTVGAMLYLVIFRKGRNAQHSAKNILWLAFWSLYGGFASQGVDNAAHIGGFLAGFLLAGLLTMKRKSE